jgi:hypothetical protein
MKILSWDVGIYNLSYCILEKNNNEEPKIIDWDIVNLVDNDLMKKNRNLLFENIPRKLHELPQLLDVDLVVIENQPSLKNPQMKSIQMILYSYFLILGKVIGNDTTKSYIDKIDFCSASNKLKVYNGPKINLEEKKARKNSKKEIVNNIISETVNQEVNDTVNDTVNQEVNDTVNETYVIDTEDEDEKPKKKVKKQKEPTLKYADKKRLAIEHAKYFLEQNNSQYINFFNSHKKKDDLSDSFLQGLYYIKQLKK